MSARLKNVFAHPPLKGTTTNKRFSGLAVKPRGEIMTITTSTDSNVQQAVPFFWVHDLERSALKFNPVTIDFS